MPQEPSARIVVEKIDSEYGRWTYAGWRPPHLAGFVERFWYSAGTSVAPRERILPNGLVELAVCLGGPHRLVEGSGPPLLQVCITGLLTRPMIIEHPTYHRVLGLRFHPAGAYAVLAMPMREVSDRTVELRDLLGKAGDELAERCHDAPTIERCFQIAADWIVERIQRSRGLDPAVACSVGRIEQTGGRVPIAELREATGYSKTRLANAFREQIGVAPKVYARIVRYRRALALLDAGARSLADVALEAGYYDQSHMTTEFRELGGLTPRDFLAAHYPGSTTAVEF